MAVMFNPETGITTEDTQTIRNRNVQTYKQIFSDETAELNTDPETPAGQLIDSATVLESQKDSDILYIANMFNPETAEGIWQDALGKIYNITRKIQQATIVNCRCHGLQGITIPIGSVVQAEWGTNRYQLIATETGTIPARNDAVKNGYIIPTATALSSTWLAATQQDASATPPVPIVPTFGDVRVIASTDTSSTGYTGKIYYWNGTAWELTSGTFVDIDFEVTETGPIAIGIGVVNTIITVIPGWDSVYNFTAGITGRDTESRADFENRRYNSVAKNSHGTADAVESNLMNLDKVQDAKCYQNRTNGNDWTNPQNESRYAGFSIEPHSIAVCVRGGEEQDIAEILYNRMDAGCGFSQVPNAGTDINKTITYHPNINTLPQIYKIIRPQDENVVIKVTYRQTVTTASTVETDIKDAIYNDFEGLNKDTGNIKVGIGETLYASRFAVAVVKTAKVKDLVSIKIGTGTTIAQATQDSISFTAIQYPVLDKTRIYCVQAT